MRTYDVFSSTTLTSSMNCKRSLVMCFLILSRNGPVLPSSSWGGNNTALKKYKIVKLISVINIFHIFQIELSIN